MQELIHIVKYKLIIFLKSNSNFDIRGLIKNLGSFLVYAAFAIGAFLFTKSILSFLLVHIKIGPFLLHRFISIILFIFFLSVNVGNIVVSYSTLYKSKEVYYLLTKPLLYSKIFIIKFFDNFFYSSATLLLMICSVIAGYGVFFKMDLWFYPVSIFLIILPFMLTAASIGVIFLMVILKLSTKVGARNVLFMFFLLYIISLILFFNISDPINMVSRVMVYYPNTNRYFGFLDNNFLKFLPNYWAADALYWISAGQFSKSILDIVLQVITAISFFSFAFFLSSKWYYQTWKDSLQFSFKKNNSAKDKNILFHSPANLRLNHRRKHC